MLLMTPIVIGILSAIVTKSAIGCASCMPKSPINGVRITTEGMRIIPCLAKPRIEALTTFPVV